MDGWMDVYTSRLCKSIRLLLYDDRTMRTNEWTNFRIHSLIFLPDLSPGMSTVNSILCSICKEQCFACIACYVKKSIREGRCLPLASLPDWWTVVTLADLSLCYALRYKLLFLFSSEWRFHKDVRTDASNSSNFGIYKSITLIIIYTIYIGISSNQNSTV
jgi:hypothetical protein